jgi:hypothetical protein
VLVKGSHRKASVGAHIKWLFAQIIFRFPCIIKRFMCLMDLVASSLSTRFSRLQRLCLACEGRNHNAVDMLGPLLFFVSTFSEIYS